MNRRCGDSGLRMRPSLRRRALVTMIWALAVAGAWAQTVDERMLAAGMVDVGKMCPQLIVRLRYATADNFVHKNMYGDLRRAYLAPEAARALVAAQKALRAINPGYAIIVYDAARPRSAQRIMWQAVKCTSCQRYVARPEHGGPHNYGVAVDVTLALNGEAVDMGTDFDTFSSASHITAEEALVRDGRITKAALANRRLLRKAMADAGFLSYRREWWHFERHRIRYARAHCRLLDF